MTADTFVPLRDLPDLQPGDLISIKLPDAVVTRTLFVFSGRSGLARGIWVTDRHMRQSFARIHNPEAWGWAVDEQKSQVCVLARLRGVERADLADDRWSETERRLRAAALAPTPTPKIGDVLTAEQVRALPVGAAVLSSHNGVWLHTSTGWGVVHVDKSAITDPSGIGDWRTSRWPDKNGTLLGFNVPHAPTTTTRADVARSLAAQGYEPAAEALRAAGLTDAPKPTEPAKPAVKAGDEVRGWPSLPSGAIVADSVDDLALVRDTKYMWVRLSGEWRRGDWHPRLSNQSSDLRIVALGPPDCTPEQARALVEAAEGKSAQQPEAKPAPLRPGDRVVGDVVPAERLGELAEGAVIDHIEQDNVWRKVAGGLWQNVAYALHMQPRDPMMAEPYLLSERHSAGRRVVALGCKAQDRTGLARELAAQGWQPAVDWLAHHGLAAREPLKVGDRVPADRLAELPAGAVVLQSAGPSALVEYVAQKTAAGWRRWCIALPVDWGTPALGSAPPDGACLVALGCAADDRFEFTRQLAACGHEPAREWLRRHDAASTPAVEAAPAVVRLRDVPPGTLADLGRGRWLYRLPSGNAWWVTYDWQRDEVVQGVFNSQHPGGWTWGTMCSLNERVLRQIPAQPADLAPGAWERLIGEAPPLPPAEPAPTISITVGTAEPPLPEPGAVLTQADLDRLPVGAVIDSHDATTQPWLLKITAVRWHWLTLARLTGTSRGSGWTSSEIMARGHRCSLVDLGAPLECAPLRAWCTVRGYEPAIRAERELTASAAGPVSPALDAGAAAVDDEDMASTQSTIIFPNGISITQKAGESDADFAQRATQIQHALSPHPPTAPVAQGGSTLDRAGAMLRAFGARAASKAVDAAVEGRALLMVDSGRLLVHGAAVKVAGALGGDGAAAAVKAGAESKVTVVAEDIAGALFAFAAGRHALADALLTRSSHRVADAIGQTIVRKGASVVEDLVEGAKALAAAATVAEIPETTAPAEDAAPSTT